MLLQNHIPYLSPLYQFVDQFSNIADSGPYYQIWNKTPNAVS